METALLDHVIEGNLDSKVLIVFLQGWPDSKELWNEKMNSKEELEQFKQLYIDFPNYGKEKISWGQDFTTIAKRIKRTVDSVADIDKRILVCHDWGCAFGYVVDQLYPKYFDFIMALDVSAFSELSGGLKAKLYVLTYQSFLVWCFLVGGFIGGALTRSASRFFEHYPSYLDKIKADRNYPYYYYWRNYLLSRFGKEERILKGYKPSVPISYFFGINKPMQFHGQRWINYLKNTQGCSIQGLEAGHWFMGKYRMLLAKEIFRIAKL